MITESVRPSKLAEIRNQPAAARFLTGWLSVYGKAGTSDAFLISGPSGSGKTSLAYALAAELGVDPMFFEKILAADCNVETVRKVTDKLHLSAWGESPWKVILVDEAHTMSLQARDAFLSVLENMPRYRLIVFTTTEPDAFDSIWRSRCKQIRLQEHPVDGLTTMLSDVSAKHGRAPSPKVLHAIATSAGGNARTALQALEMHLLCTPSAEDPTCETVAAVLAAPATAFPEPLERPRRRGRSVTVNGQRLTDTLTRRLFQLHATGSTAGAAADTWEKLASFGLVERSGDKWTLTAAGRKVVKAS